MPGSTGARPGGRAVAAGVIAVALVVVVSGVVAARAVTGWGGEVDDSSLTTFPSQGTKTVVKEPVSSTSAAVKHTPVVSPTAGVSKRVGAKPTAVSTAGQKAARPKKSTAPPDAGVTPGTTMSGKMEIKNLATGFCMDLAPGGTAQVGTVFTQNYCSSSTSQQFEQIRKDGTFLLRNVRSHYCLDIFGTEDVETSDVTAWDCVLGDADNMMFRARAQGDGYYIVNVKSGLCLDVSDAGAGDQMPDAGLTMYPCSPDDDHIWKLG